MKPNQASATAYLIAESTVISGNTELITQFIPARAVELSRQFIQPRSWAAKLRRSLRDSTAGRMVLRGLERITIPGLKLHYVLRKRFLEETARTALADGFTQVVVFGAGFDTLALRLSREYPDVHFIEVDHPSTQLAKLSALGESNPSPGNLRFVAEELTGDDWPAALHANGYQRAARTLFIAEGLLMYFTPDQVARMFATVRDEGIAGSRLAFTFMEPRADGRIAFRGSSWLVNLWLRFYGEPFKWSLKPALLPAFLARAGFTEREGVNAADFRQRYLTQSKLAELTLAEGECVCIAELK